MSFGITGCSQNASEFTVPIFNIKAHILQPVGPTFPKRATARRVQRLNRDRSLIHTLRPFASPHPWFLYLSPLFLPHVKPSSCVFSQSQSGP